MRERGWRHLAVIGLAACLTVGLAAGTVGQGSGVGMLLPGADRLGAPEWVTVGTRISWYAAGASIANADFQWQESEDGAWQDPVTGKRYDQTDAATASGEGIFQLDVVGIDGTDVAVQWVLYGLDRFAGRFFGGIAGGAREPGASPEGFWIHPALLADVPEANLPDLRILRGPYTVEGVTYAGIAIVSPDQNRYSSLIHDLGTGVLLSTTTKTQGNASPLHTAGQDPPEANTQLTIGRYLGTRQRDGAAMLLPLPDWAAPGTVLRYGGTWTFVNPYDPGGTPAAYPAQMTVTLGAGGSTWLDYAAEFDVDIGGLPNHTEASGVAGGNGPWWIAPASLAAVTSGQVLDEDPVTGQRLVVTDVGDGTVTIDSDLAGLSARSTYDTRTGTLVAVTRTEVGAGLTTALELMSVQ